MRQIESFFLGIIAALGALILQFIILAIASFFIGDALDYSFGQSSGSDTAGLSVSSLLPLITVIPTMVLLEEVLKYLIIVKRIELISVGRSLIFNSLLLGLGFASLEVFLIYGKVDIQMMPLISIQNIAEIALIHIITAGIIGYFIAVNNPKRVSTFAKTILVVFLIHFTYNIMAIYRNDFLNPFIVAFLAVLVIINVSNLIGINKKLAS